MGQISDDAKMLLAGFVFILISLVCFKLPWEFLWIYEFIKDDKAALRRIKIIRAVYGYISLITGVFVICRMIIKFLFFEGS